MKCKKHDQTWFNNKYKQLLKQKLDPDKKLIKLNSFMKLAKKYNIVPDADAEYVKKVREDFGIPKTQSSIRARKKRLIRKRKLKHNKR